MKSIKKIIILIVVVLMLSACEDKNKTITFNANGGSGTMESQTVESNVITQIKLNTFTRNGYSFIGWNTQENGSGTSYNDNDSIILNDNITLYAQWKENQPEKYMITFNANGGSGSMESQTVESNVIIQIKLNTFIRNGYSFIGWNTQANGSGTSYSNNEEILLTNNITLYAQWKELAKYTVKFDTNGGSAVKNVTVYENEKLSKPTNPTKKGYKFISWQLAGKDYDFNNTVTKNITLKAKWKALGKEIRVMVYNVARYNNDTSQYIFTNEEKMKNFRQLLANVNADYIFASEDNKYVDVSPNSQSGNDSLSWLYEPLYTKKVGVSASTIYSKNSFTSAKANVTISYSFNGKKYGGPISKAYITSGNKKLGLYSLHLPRLSEFDGVDSNNNNVNDGAEIRLGLLKYLVDNVIKVDAPDYWIFGGDLNTLEDGEVAALLDYCAVNGFQISNGGDFGLHITHPQGNMILDFIISSPNTMIKNAVVLSDWFDKLYSDHIPHFADIVLLENE